MVRKCLPGGCLLALLLVPASAPGQTSRENYSQVVSPFSRRPAQSSRGPNLDRVEELIVTLTNEFRAKHGRGKLTPDPELNEAARYFADYLARTDKFSHTADGKHPWERVSEAGYDYCIASENIAYVYRNRPFGTGELAAELMDQWKKSPPHRKNLLNPDLTEIGVGVARSARTGRYYAVQDFGRPRSLEIAFKIANRTDSTVKYEVDGKDFDLEPGYVMTLHRCRPPKLQFKGTESAGRTYHPKKGSRYVVRRDGAGRLTVDAEETLEPKS